jgi:hypothetical protein
VLAKNDDPPLREERVVVFSVGSTRFETVKGASQGVVATDEPLVIPFQFGNFGQIRPAGEHLGIVLPLRRELQVIWIDARSLRAFVVDVLFGGYRSDKVQVRCPVRPLRPAVHIKLSVPGFSVDRTHPYPAFAVIWVPRFLRYFRKKSRFDGLMVSTAMSTDCLQFLPGTFLVVMRVAECL